MIKGRLGPVLALAAVAGLVVVAVVAFVGGGDDAGADVVLQPLGSAGPDDFAGDLDLGAAAGRPEQAEQAADADELEGVGELDAAVALTGLTVRGNEAGLYAAAREEPVCDVDQLVELLTGDGEGDPALADVWFEALDRHVGERERDDYLDELTPLRLRFDTRVTSHGYADGGVTAYPAILQAGTAVLVDEHGIPRVRCTGGSPLREPEPADEDLSGEEALDVDALAANPEDAWDGFDPATVVVVESGRVPEGFEVTDLAGAEAFTRPVGSDGNQDRGAFTPRAPRGCEGECHALQITVETVAGTPASVTWEGVGQSGSQTETSLSWADGEAAPGPYRYDVHHAWEIYRTLGPDDAVDASSYDDPAHDDEVLLIETPGLSAGTAEPPRVMECVPGEVTITITVDGAVAQTTTEDVACTSSELEYVLE